MMIGRSNDGSRLTGVPLEQIVRGRAPGFQAPSFHNAFVKNISIPRSLRCCFFTTLFIVQSLFFSQINTVLYRYLQVRCATCNTLLFDPFIVLWFSTQALPA